MQSVDAPKELNYTSSYHPRTRHAGEVPFLRSCVMAKTTKKPAAKKPAKAPAKKGYAKKGACK